MEGKFVANLLTGRTLRQGIGKELSKTSDRYRDSVSVCEVHPKDMEEAGIKQGENIRVTTKHGNVVVKCVSSNNIPRKGLVFIPYGPYASQLVYPDTDSTGMPTFKGIQAEIEKSEDNVLGVKEMVSKYWRR